MRFRFLDMLTVLAALLLMACQQGGSAKQSAVDREKLANVNTELAFQYMQENEYAIALKKLEKALEADPNYASAHNTMGILRNQLGQFDEAEASFQRALRIEPDNSAALNNYGQFLCQRKRYEQGQQQFMRAIENPLYKTPAVAYSNAGSCALDAGDLDAADTHFRAALSLDPYLSPALIQMADVSFQLDRHLPARGYLQRYLQVAPASARALWLGIRIERQLGDRDSVASYSLQLKKSFPDSVETKLLLESNAR